ncbi:MAG: glycosyltransferase [Deltaproteobacteria bacterium]|nr:glycosyltransferase [Deltaproteobacteria bacterium]MBW2032853.1 glycosyltransferase [Deltaproteobacteria bacterium]
MPKVSIIIPTYNRAHLVERAINSVLNQTYCDFELIVVDDASTDNTQEVIKSIGDKRIRYIRHGANRGGSAARNTGIGLSEGKYIALLDDDDEWLPAKLEKQVNAFEEVSDKVGLIYTGSEVREEGNNAPLKTYIPRFRGNVRNRLLMGPTVCGSQSVLIKRECFSKAGVFDESLKSCQDWDMWKRISEDYDFDFVPAVLARTYLHSEQISSNFASLIPGRTKMLEKHMKEFQKHPEILIIHLKRLGKLHSINGTWSQAAYWFKEALKVDFWQIFKIAAWCIVELPRVKWFSDAKIFNRYVDTTKSGE